VDNDPSSFMGILDRAKSGEAAAFSELCEPHRDRLFRQAFVLAGDFALAQDLAQETLIEAWRSLRRFDGSCLFFTWLCAILFNRHKNHLRRRRWLKVVSLFGTDSAEGALPEWENADSSPGPDAQAEQKEAHQILRRGLNQLPPKQREVIYLRFFVDTSLEHISNVLNCSVGTVKSRLFNGLERLRLIHRRNLDEAKSSKIDGQDFRTAAPSKYSWTTLPTAAEKERS
jgi:RNA polymerase sigma-70 factor (ECF subfamily)